MLLVDKRIAQRRGTLKYCCNVATDNNRCKPLQCNHERLQNRGLHHRGGDNNFCNTRVEHSRAIRGCVVNILRELQTLHPTSHKLIRK